jgi:hypothetical protein
MRFTIYTVPGPLYWEKQRFQGGLDYLLKSLEFISELNPEDEFLVALAHAREFGGLPELPTYTNIEILVYEIPLSELQAVHKQHQSSQHGSLLNFVLKNHQLDTEYFIILDPDCYVLQSNVFSKLVLRMRLHNLSIIGVPYPSNIQKLYYWDFPTAYFQMLSSNKIKPYEMNFLPDESKYICDKKQSSGLGFENPKLVLFGHSILHRFPILLTGIMSSLKKKRNHFSILIASFSKNFPYRNMELYRDTGWFNRERFRESNFEILPHRVDKVQSFGKFRQNEYLKFNLDLALAKIDPGWHAMAHGIFEGRKLGKQLFRYRVLSFLLRPFMRRYEVFPASSIYMEESIFDQLDSSFNWENLRNGFEYINDSHIFCIHLGHQGKGDVEGDISKLEYLKFLILKRTRG